MASLRPNNDAPPLSPAAAGLVDEDLEGIRYVFSQLSLNTRLTCCRRYEDFTTIDWIQDSILERNRRIRRADKTHASHRGPRGEITLPWLWAQVLKVIDAAQTWFVVTIVGKRS